MSNHSITFARRIGNHIEMITIHNHPDQNFLYFYNPSKLSYKERQQKYVEKQELELLKKILTH